MENSNQSSSKIKLDFKDSKYATGRRKTSIAKVWLKKGSGKFYVNGKTLDDYFTSSSHKMQILRPFEIINQSTDYDVKSKVVGGGHTGQAGALVHGISRALLKFDENFKPIGAVPSSKVLRTPRETKMSSIMDDSIFLVPVDMDREEVGNSFENYGLNSAEFKP